VTLAILLVLVAIAVILFAIGTDLMRIRQQVELYSLYAESIAEAERRLEETNGNCDVITKDEA